MDKTNTIALFVAFALVAAGALVVFSDSEAVYADDSDDNTDKMTENDYKEDKDEDSTESDEEDSEEESDDDADEETDDTEDEDSDDESDDETDDESDDEDEDEDEDDEDEEDEFDVDDIIDPVVTNETITNEDGTVTEVRYADGTDEDGNTVHLEKRVTVLADGSRFIEEIEQVTDSKGNVEEEKSIKLKTQDGEFETEVETYTDASGKVTTEVETDIDAEDDVPLSAEKIQALIARSNEVIKNMPQVADEIRNFVNILSGADGSVQIEPGAFQQLVENGTGFQVSTGQGTISFDADICENMSGMAKDVEITMKQNDRTGLTQEQLDAIGDNQFVTLDAVSADGKIHQLNGNADITLSDAAFAGKKVVYVDEQGNTETVESSTVGQQLSFTTNHFSVFMVVDEDSGSSTAMFAAIAVAALAVIAVAAYVVTRKH